MEDSSLHALGCLQSARVTLAALDPGARFLARLAWDGLGGGVLAATLSFLVVGPLYLARQWWLGPTGRILPPEPRTAAEQARLLRLFALVNAGAALGLLVATARTDWLPGGGWSALAALAAV